MAGILRYLLPLNHLSFASNLLLISVQCAIQQSNVQDMPHQIHTEDASAHISRRKSGIEMFLAPTIRGSQNALGEIH